MSDWDDACDPVPDRKPPLTEAERKRRLGLAERRRWESAWNRLKADAASTHRLDPDFDERF